MTLDLENFEQVKLRGEELYRSLTDVHCPYFNDKVLFNAQGLGHLKFKRHGHARPRQDQYMRFKLLHLVPVILRNSKTLQGIWETRSFEKTRIYSRTDVILQEVTYYEFVAVMENVRVKVIIKKIAGGQRVFWSIIPFWDIDKRTQKRKLHSGYPVED